MDTLKPSPQEVDLCVSNYGTTKGKEYSLAILPWGATEPHNYHLPYLTDSILSHDIAVDAAGKAFTEYGLLCMVLPPVSFGSQNPGQKELLFCIHSRYSTQVSILEDIIDSLERQGIRKMLIVNGHGGNSFKNMIRDLCDSHPDFTVASSEWYRIIPDEGYFEEPGDHADEKEASVMLHYHPELVFMNQAGEGKAGGFRNSLLRSGKVWIPRRWDLISTDTGIGNPFKATAEKGRRYAEAVASSYAEFLRDFSEGDLYLR